MLRKAGIKDVKPIHKLLQHYGDKGELLSRPLSVLYEQVRDFTVYQEHPQGDLLGCCALQICWEDLAEIRSMAVAPEHAGRGIGSELARNAIDEASQMGVKTLFTLTYRPTFFERFGFKRIDRSELPLKIWGDCLNCVKFPDCDETAMMRDVPPHAA